MKARTLVLLALAVNLTACGGGGGGGGGNAPVSPPIITPVVSSSSSSSSSSVSSSSSSSSSSKAPQPIMVEKTSYLNKIKFGDPNHGKTYIMPNAKGHEIRPLVYGDFLQDGSITALATDNSEDLTIHPNFWKRARIHFFKQVGTKWVDITDKLLTDAYGCVTIKKASVADFNNDGKPDIYLGCHGADTFDTVGESQRILLSQADGKYLNAAVPLVCYCHASAAGDINGDGNIDIVTYDNLTIANSDGAGYKHYPHPIALLGNGDGTFKQDTTLFNKVMEWKPIFTLDLIDYGRGFLDLFVGGAGAEVGVCGEHCFENSIVHNDGMGRFTSTPKAIDNTRSTTGKFYGLALDFIVQDNGLYMNQIGDEYYAIAVRKLSLQDTSKSTILYEYAAPNRTRNTWFPWLTVLGNGTIASMCDFSGITEPFCNWAGI